MGAALAAPFVLALAAACGGQAVGDGAQSETAGGAAGAGPSPSTGGSGGGGLCEGVACPLSMTCVPLANASWCLPDADQDGIADDRDDCPYVANPSQADADGDGVGDACDLCAQRNDIDACGAPCCSDPDGDGVAGAQPYGGMLPNQDNCPYLANPDQLDTDQDGVGDACDLCLDVYNPLSPCGDPCLDSDGDGVADLGVCGRGDTDSCQNTPSASTADSDEDGVGDVCDPDGVAPGPTALRDLDRSRRERRLALLSERYAAGILDRETFRIAARAIVPA